MLKKWLFVLAWAPAISLLNGCASTTPPMAARLVRPSPPAALLIRPQTPVYLQADTANGMPSLSMPKTLPGGRPAGISLTR